MVPTFQFAVREDLIDVAVKFLPQKAEPGSTGWDVRAAQKDRKPINIKPGEYVRIPLGFRALPAEGWWYELRPRSSTFAKKHLNCLYGVIDHSYENEVLLAVQYLPDIHDLGKTLSIEFGEAIGQIIPIKLVDIQALSISNKEIDAAYKARAGLRGIGGFGSTSG
jgi:dUTPase